MIIGTNSDNGIIEKCAVSKGKIHTDGNAGWVAGENYGKIVSCSISGDGSTFIDFIENAWVIYAGCDVRSIGGITGLAKSSSTILDSSVNNIDIKHGRVNDVTVDACHIGPVVGWNDRVVSNSYASSVTPSLEKVDNNSASGS